MMNNFQRLNSIVGRYENPLPKCPSKLTPKEKQLVKNYQRLQDLEAEIKYLDENPYLVGMNSQGAFAFFFPDSGTLENQTKAKCVDPVFDPNQPQLPQPRFSFAEYFRTKAEREQEEEEREAMEQEENAAWKRITELRNERENRIIPPAAMDGVSKNYKIKIEKLGMVGTKLTVTNFDYMPVCPDDAPNMRRIAVLSQRTIEHPNLKYQ